MQPKKPAQAAKLNCEPNPQKRAAIQKVRVPRLRVAKDEGATRVFPDHPDKVVGSALLMEAVGTTNPDFVNGLLRQVVNAGWQGPDPDEDGANFVLAVVAGIKPRDQLEAMLAAQMAAIHIATMTFAWRLAHVVNIPQQDSAERALNKLARTFAMQMETLKRYRTGGEQKVSVQHVSVNEGGQAIVGNVTQAAREAAPEKPANSSPSLTHARTPEMPIIGKTERAPVPSRRRRKDGSST